MFKWVIFVSFRVEFYDYWLVRDLRYLETRGA